MYSKRFLLITWLLVTPIVTANNSFANDLDDGIKIDDDIKTYDSIKQDTNSTFISQKVQSRANAAAKRIKDKYGEAGISEGGEGGGTNVGGVNIGAGAKHKGDIYIVIKDSKIDATTVNK